MKKLFFKLKEKLKEKGFTLVELLAVIVILAIIMIIAIPAVLNTMESARRKTFAEYVDKSTGLAQKQITEDQMMGNKTGQCIVYNIKNELSINNTGDFDGWVLINTYNNDIYITLFNDDYVLISYKYNDSSKKIDDYIEKRNSENEVNLTVDFICSSSSCGSCDNSVPVTEPIIPADLIDGKSFNNKMEQLAGYKSKIKHIVYTKDLKDTTNVISTTTSENPVYMWFDTDTLYIGSIANKIFLSEDSSKMFYDIGLLTSLDVSIFDTSRVKNMSSMFNFLDSVTEITGLEKFDTSNVQDMSSMFSMETNIKKLDLSNFNTSRVTNMSNMFSSCYAETIDVSSFDTTNVTDMSGMFTLTGARSIDLSSFNTANVTDISGMFSNSLFTILDLRSFDTSNVLKTGYMFEYCNTLEKIYVSDKWNVSKVTSSEMMFYHCDLLRNYAENNWDVTFAHTGNGGYLSVYP